MSFTKDSRAENFLTLMGVEFKYRSGIPISDLRAGWQERNLARPVAVRDDAVEEYAALSLSGSPAPAPILLWVADKEYDVLDGVQRLVASELNGVTRISGYVVKCDSDDVITSIKILANARMQGRAEPIEWTRRKAVYELVVKRGLSAKEVSQMGGWRVADVERIATSIQVAERIVGIGGPENVSDALCSVINHHSNAAAFELAPQPIAEFVNTLKQAKLSANDAEPYIEEFFKPITKSRKAFETYSERLRHIRDDPEVTTRLRGRKYELKNDVNLRRTLRSALTIAEELRDTGEMVSYVDEFFSLTKRIQKVLHDLSGRHAKPDQSRVPADKWRDKCTS